MSSYASTPRTRIAIAALLACGLFAVTLLAIPSVAQAQSFSVEIGSYSIPDSDGVVQASIMVDPGAVGLAAIGVSVAYPSSLVLATSCDVEPDLGSCNIDTAGQINLQSVTGDVWDAPFVLAVVEFTGQGVEDTGTLDVEILEAFSQDLQPVTGNAIDGDITVSSRAPSAVLSTGCESNDGTFSFALDNPMDESITYTLAVDGVSDVEVTLETMTSSTETVSAVPDAPRSPASYSVTASGGFGTILDGNEVVRCDAEVATAVTCSGNSGIVTTTITNYTGSFATYRVTVQQGNGPVQNSSRSISDGLTTVLDQTVSIDGDYAVTVERNNSEISSETATVTCGGAAPTPTPIPATPTPIPPTPTPVPPTPTPTPGGGGGDPVIGSDAPIEIMHATTCLASNGRVDTNIVNTGDAAAAYRIEFGGLSARQATVAAGDWWRMPITGRPDKDHQIVVKRDGVVVSDTFVTVACDADQDSMATPEVQVVNACRAGNGYALFQFANPNAAQKGWVIEFEGVPNRSTSAQAHGGAVRAVTGRQDGTYAVLVRTGGTTVAEFELTVDCD